MRDYDLAIVGAGMVGTALALLCRRANPAWRIALIDPEPPVASAAPARPSFDSRATALSAGSAQCFVSLGAWDPLSASAAPIHQVHISDKGYLPGQRIDRTEHGVEALGYVIPNRSIGAALAGRLSEQSAIESLTAAVEKVEFGAEAAQLTLDSGESVTAKLVVVADGAHSALRDRLGIAVRERNYGQRAVVANVRVSKNHHNNAYERFTDQGPLALLPLADPRELALVWTRPENTPEPMDDSAFLAELQRRFGYRLGRFEAVSPRADYPLALREAAEQVRSRLVVMGNAAHSLHPVAGQGFNLALRDCVVLAECLASAKDPGILACLQAYERARLSDQQLTAYLSHSMVKLFTSANPAAVTLRHSGLLAMELLAPLKTGFSRQMMGLTGVNYV